MMLGMSTPAVQPSLAAEPNPYVPGLSSDLYRGIAGAGAASPEWLQAFAEFFTEAAIIGFLAAFAVLFVQARNDEDHVMARAVLPPLGTALAYLVSEVVKSFIQEDRPCRAVAHAQSIAACPELGDWSFPSNHSTIAAAAAIGLFCARRSWGWAAVVVGLLTGLSRVFVGVHYPHDVLVGLLLGGAVAALLPMLAERITPLVGRLRETSAGELVLGAGDDGWDDFADYDDRDEHEHFDEFDDFDGVRGEDRARAGRPAPVADDDRTVQLPAVDDATVQLPTVRR